MQGFRFFPTRRSVRSICVMSPILCAALLGSETRAQDAPAADQSQPAAPVISVTTHEVLLDVVVTEGGRAVTGLKASDFTVLEDGKPQAVASLEEHTPMAAAMNAPATAIPAVAFEYFYEFCAGSEYECVYGNPAGCAEYAAG